MLDTNPQGNAEALAVELATPDAPFRLRLASTATAPSLAWGPAPRFAATRAALAAGDLVAATLTMAFVALAAGGAMSLGAALLTAGAAVLSSGLSGAYGRTAVRLSRRAPGEAAGFGQAGLVCGLVLTASTELGALSVVTSLGLWLAAVVATREALHRLRRRGAGAERCLVIGAPDRFESFRRQLDAAGTTLDIVQLVDLAAVGRTAPGGHLVEDLIARSDAQRVVVLADDPADQAAQVARRSRNAGVTVTIIPRVVETLGPGLVTEQLGGSVAFSVRAAQLSSRQHTLKRAVDVAGAAAILVVLAPLMLAIALAIKVMSPGPALFGQQRVGRHGRTFSIFKFRTMVDGADDLKDSLRHRNEAQGIFKLADDPRVTRLGRVLRRTSLDELPQLLNVLRGDMSLVGPRPLIADEDAQIDGWHRDRLRLAPGMTGPWQIMGSARIGLQDMVMLDHHYVSNWSLWGDVQLLLRTVSVVLMRRGI